MVDIILLVIAGVVGALLLGLWVLLRALEPKDAPPRPTATQARAQKRKAAEAAQRRVVCPHCHEAGHVTKRAVQRKQGVSGGKATAGLLTAGVSLVAVGLSKKGWVTELTCGNCGMRWDVT